MPSSIRDRLKQAIQREEEKTLNALKASHERARIAEERFRPVSEAAEEIRQEMNSVPSIKLTVNPDSVWVVLADRNFTFGFNPHTLTFVGQESGHSWYDGETYTYGYEWESAEECIEAMVRLCARYVQMARAISSAKAES